MEQLDFNEVIERINAKLLESDSDVITTVYNQLFDMPITYVDDDTWEIEVDDNDVIIGEDDDDFVSDDDVELGGYKNKKATSRFDRFIGDEFDSFSDGDDEY